MTDFLCDYLTKDLVRDVTYVSINGKKQSDLKILVY